MAKMKSLTTVNTAITGSVQRPLPLSSYRSEVEPERAWINHPAGAASPIYVGWSVTATGAKPSDITAATAAMEILPGEQRLIFSENGFYPKVDLRHLCFKGDAADSAYYVKIVYWTEVDQITPS